MNEITPEMLNLALMYLQSTNTLIKKIKVKSDFFDYLKETCHYTYLNTYEGEGIRTVLIGVPIELDDTIENEYYELVY